MDSTDSFIYLHGFASGPRSAKAKYLGDRFQSLNINLQTPDLNQIKQASYLLHRKPMFKIKVYKTSLFLVLTR
jgi:predicted esterase YcpF (UPF0227 family)